MVEPLEDNIYQAIKSGELREGRIKKKNKEASEILSNLGWGGDEIRNIRVREVGDITSRPRRMTMSSLRGALDAVGHL